MKFLSDKHLIKQLANLLFVIFFLRILVGAPVLAQIPQKPTPPKFVNDFTNTLSVSQQTTLEKKLVNYNDSTSTQILVVLISNLNGQNPSDFAFALGDAWGVGQKEKDNGLIILVKPKTNSSKGEAVIATGYGMETSIPDALAKRIVEDEMIPAFKNNDYYKGINNAIDAVINLASGNYKADQTEAETSPFLFLISVFAILFVIFIISASKNSDDINGNGGSGGKKNHNISSFLTGLWLGSLGSRSGSGSWGVFSGNSSGGDFGGFGGGSFGGGGASGSW
ncbi:MAG: TPM domain-containing protein [Lentimicrobiaceae bacterium]|jgi:uncharacterized protein|nr:TPM domain-containing protein [Lentimicrobiaceae bacterium]